MISPMRQTVTRLAFLTALLSLGTSHPVLANDPWYKHCKHTCKSCNGKSNCTPGVSTYTVEATGESDTQDPNDPKAKCTVDHEKSLSTDVSGDPVPRGVTSLIYRREGSIFDGVSPDYVKYESVDGVKKPIQMPMSHSVMIFSDLADGSGHQTAQYPKSHLPAPNAQGVYTVPSGIEPISITIYRNPDGPATTTSGNLEIVHKQRHPQSGIWVTRTIRMHAPQNDNNWKTEFFLGNPSTTPSYREITIIRSPHPTNVSEESTRETTRDRDSQGDLVITSDISATYGFYKYGAPVRLSETNHTGTDSELTSNWTYYTDRLDQASFNRPATLRRNDGKWENYTYSGSLVTGVLVTKTVSGWLDQAAPEPGQPVDENLSRVVIEIEANKETGTFGREEKIRGVLVSKTWGERYKDNARQVIEKSRTETGSSTLLTIRTGYPTDESASETERGRLKSLQNPDGTLVLHHYELQGTNRVETVEEGAGSLSGVVDGTRTISTYTKDETLIKEAVVDIASGVELSSKEAIGFDSEGEPTKWAHNHNPDDYSEILNGCCGIDSTRTREGIVTTYTRDGLKRPVAEVSQGVTMSYSYGKKAIGGMDYPSVTQVKTAGSLSLDLSTIILDHSGRVIEKINPDADGDGQPETTTISRNVASRTVTTIHPDGGTEIQIGYVDGKSKSQTGTAVAPAAWDYETHALQGGGLVTTSYGGSSSSTRWRKIYQSYNGRTLAIKVPGVSEEMAIQLNTYDEFQRLVRSVDADGVSTIFAYNAKGERYRSVLDLNQNGEIDVADRVSDVVQDTVGSSPVGSASRTRTIIYDLSDAPIEVATTYRSVDGERVRTETLGSGVTQTSMGSPLDRIDGDWTSISTNANGTKSTITYSNWLPTSYACLDVNDGVMVSTAVGYDVLRREIFRTDSRKSALTVRTTYNSSGKVGSVTEDLATGSDRVTSYSYDAMGRLCKMTLPDSSDKHTSYWPTGLVKAEWGAQTTPTVRLYSPQRELIELRSFRSANLALAPDETTAGFDKTTWSFDDRFQMTAKSYPASESLVYAYTPGGKLHTRTSAGGVVTTYGYDAAGRLETTDYSDETPGVVVVYDKLGRQTSVSNGIAKSEFSYNSASLQLDAETISYDLDASPGFEFTRVLVRSHDSLGRDNGWEVKNGSVSENGVTYEYDDISGRIETIAGQRGGVFTYGYVPGSNLIASISSSVHVVSNTWLPDRDQLGVKVNKVEGVDVSSYVYNVNEIGQRSAVIQSGIAFGGGGSSTTDLEYDVLGNMSVADHSTNNAFDCIFEYDATGNRRKAALGLVLPMTENYEANRLNQYVSVNGMVPTYDLDGNMRDDGGTQIAGVSQAYTWDAENRLLKVTRIGDGSTVASYAYDALGRRIARSVAGSTTVHIYDRWNNIADYVGGSVENLRVWGLDLSGELQRYGGVGGLLAVTNKLGVSHYPLYDGSGNVTEYLDELGEVIAHYEYGVFGDIVVATGAASEFDYLFATKRKDVETGFSYYGYRYYSAQTGRWVSRDPLGERGGLNMYSFVRNDVPNGIDVLGLAPELVSVTVHMTGYGDATAETKIGRSYKKGGHWELYMGIGHPIWVTEWGFEEKLLKEVAGIETVFDVFHKLRVDCETEKVELAAGNPVILGGATTLTTTIDSGPISLTVTQDVDNSSARMDINGSPSVTAADGKKTIKVDVSAWAVLALTVKTDVNLTLEAPGWSITVGGSNSKTQRILADVDKHPVEVGCQCKDGKWIKE